MHQKTIYLIFFTILLTTFSVNVSPEIRKRQIFFSNCVSATIDILRSVQRDNWVGAGQVITADHWFHLIYLNNTIRKYSDIADSKFLDNFRIPWIIYGFKHRHLFNFSINVIHFKFSSSNFVHLDHTSLPGISADKAGSLDFIKRHVYNRFRIGLNKDLANPRSIFQKDLFITAFTPSTFIVPNKQIHSRFHVWVGCEGAPETSLTAPLKDIICKTVSSQLFHHIACLYASRNSYKLIAKTNACRGKIMHISSYFNQVCSTNQSMRVSNACKEKFSDKEKLFDKESAGLKDDVFYNMRSRKAIPDPFGKNDFLYGSLVFIAKKIPEGNSTNTWGPFTVASWIGILAAYTVTAIVFGIIKIVTMNNLDNSWYDCIINQFMNFVNEERTTKKNKVSNVGIDNDEVDENANVRKGKSRKGSHVLRRISVRSTVVSTEDHNMTDSENVVIQGFQHSNRGKMSKAILYGTIRVVSFILLAMYEGKLYNTITFPKSKLMASFDELIANEKYFIKVSNEAARYENISEKIRVNAMPKYDGGAMLTSENRSAKVVESVNILDCVNWVEAGPDSNHACVGYEFELRNLHKAQKSDKILVKSKQKILRFSSSNSMRLRRRRGFTLFPGGFQISKWILESGILQLWSIVENAFMESLINPNWSDPFKVFTIRDYLGLFVVYSLLLILASIMFLLEHSISLGKKMLRNKKFKSARKIVLQSWRHFMNTMCELCVVCCRVVPTVKVKYVKWRKKKYSQSVKSMNRIFV